MPEHQLKQDEPIHWNSSLSISCYAKTAVAAYGTDGSISVLSPSQLHITANVINILSPIEEITKKNLQKLLQYHKSYHLSEP